MTLRQLAFPVICLFVVTLATTAHADTWIYDFSGTNSAPGGDGLSVAFQYSAQGPISTDTSLLSAQLISCTNCLISSLSPAVVFEPSNVFGSSVQFNDLGNVASEYIFSFGAFSNPGKYISTNPFNSGTLTVQVVPEPSSILLFLSGLGVLIGVAPPKASMGLSHRAKNCAQEIKKSPVVAIRRLHNFAALLSSNSGGDH